MPRIRLFLQTVIVSILAAIAYGVIHNQITIRICPEYFTVWHPPIFPQDNLTKLAALWGVVASWWMGAILGFILGACAVFGKHRAAQWNTVLKSIGAILFLSGSAATVTGLIVWPLNWTAPEYALREIVFLDKSVQRAFTIDLAIHETSYDVAALSTIVLSALILKRRKIAQEQYSYEVASAKRVSRNLT